MKSHAVLVRVPLRLNTKKITFLRGAAAMVARLGSFSKHDRNLNGDVLRNKRSVHTKQRERIISSPNGLINNVLVL